MNQEARYDSNAEMHKNAALGLKQISDHIEFIQIDPKLKATLTQIQTNNNNIENNPENKEEDGGSIEVEVDEDDIDEDKQKYDNSHATFKQVYQQ